MAKTGKAKLEAAVKRLFSETFDQDEPLPEYVRVKREDLETVLLCFKVRLAIGAVPQWAEQTAPPKLDPRQR